MSFFYRVSVFFSAFLLLSGVFVQSNIAQGEIHPAPEQRPIFTRDGLTIIGQDGGRQNLWVEVARSPDELAYGLMKMNELPGTDGMLFVAAQPSQLYFWMKDTLISLDLLFIDSAGKVISIAANQKPMSLHFIPSGGIAKAVLEIQGGMAVRWGIKSGDKLIYRDFQP